MIKYIFNCNYVLAGLFIIFSQNNSNAQGTWYNLDGGLGCNASTCQYWQWAYAICPDTVNNLLYVGGEFNLAGNISVGGLAQWDGNSWANLPNNSFTYKVNALITYRGSLYVADSASGVWKFDGSNWTQLPPLDGPVHCFCIYNDTLYAGGGFISSGSTTTNGIAKWNGAKWLPLGNGIYGSCCHALFAMCVYQGKLIVAGYFTNAGNQSITSIAAWDGTTWSQLGSGIDGSVYYNILSALDTFQGKLYVAGVDSVNNHYVNEIATWDGTNWDSLPERAGMEIHALQSYSGYLFIGGDAGLYSGYIEKFDGENITAVDSGANVSVYSLAAWNGSLYVGGEFDTVGSTLPAKGIARWTTTTGIEQLQGNNEQISVYPNPASNQLTISSKQFPMEQLQIENVLGQTLIEQNYGAGLQKQTIDVSAFPQGIYFYRLDLQGGEELTGKIVVIK